MSTFSIKNDKAMIETGGFFYQAYLKGKSGNEQSPDERYCQDCFEYLSREAEVLPESRKRKSWIPRRNVTRTPPVKENDDAKIESVYYNLKSS